MNTYIPERFKNVVELHLYKNHIDMIKSPLILLISGYPGEGKTYQVEKIIDNINAKTLSISTGEMEDKYSGVPTQRIRSAYMELSNIRETDDNQIVALIMNDIDVGVGNWGEAVQYTVNTQNIIGELMNIADHPNSMDGKMVKRVPIIMTCNDVNKLYKPLIRAGRMTHFKWEPNLNDKINIINTYFESLSQEEIEELIKYTQNAFGKMSKKYIINNIPVSFYAQIKNHLIDDICLLNINRYGLKKAITYAKTHGEIRINYSLDVLKDMVDKMVYDYIPRNYLEVQNDKNDNPN